jgi:hypothetical protein
MTKGGVRVTKKAKGGVRAKGLVKLIKKVATQVEKKHIETKYRAMLLLDNQPLSNTLITGGLNSQLLPVIPTLQQGSESFQRVGTRVECQRLNVNCQIDFDPKFLENFDGWVRVFFVTNKSQKSQTQYTNIPPDQFLDLGNGVAEDWKVNFPSMSATYPVKNEEWSLIKSHTFRLSKNVEKTTGSATNPYSTNIGHSSHLFNFKLRCPKKLIYEDSTNLVYPTNHGIFMGLVYWASDSTQYDAETDVVRATVRSHMYYKDG